MSALRQAVRRWLAEYAAGRSVGVALSGGADSTALTAAAVAEAGSVTALVVDHGLQSDSAAVAAQAAATARELGCVAARVLPVRVGRAGGPEAAARRARYAALDAARAGSPVLFGHTLDDQAESVLLGLGRGSGPRSIQGMRPFDPPWGRPLLAVRRTVTRQACADLGVTPYEDPHNSAPEFTRVRLRTEALPLLEQILGGGVAPALARTATQLQEDGAVLDAAAVELLTNAGAGAGLSVAVLAAAPPAVRRRTVRAWLRGAGVTASTDRHLRAVDRLVTDWHGQGPVAVGGAGTGARLVVARRHGRLALERAVVS